MGFAVAMGVAIVLILQRRKTMTNETYSGVIHDEVVSSELLKYNKLEYLSLVPSELSSNVILGSCIRALGKEDWKVSAFLSGQNYGLVSLARYTLGEQERLHVYRGEEGIDRLQQERTVPNLVIVDAENAHLVDEIVEQQKGKFHLMVTADSQPGERPYDLVSRFTYDKKQPGGIWAYTGDGKGKSTSSFGHAYEHVLAQIITAENPEQVKPVPIIQWYKAPNGTGGFIVNEHKFPQNLRQSMQHIQFYPTGLGFLGSPQQDVVQEWRLHKQSAEKGLQLTQAFIRSGQHPIIVCDELLDTIKQFSPTIEPLLSVDVVRELLEEAKDASVSVILSGREVPLQLMPFIDTSVVIDKVKHPFDRGIFAHAGLDF